MSTLIAEPQSIEVAYLAMQVIPMSIIRTLVEGAFLIAFYIAFFVIGYWVLVSVFFLLPMAGLVWLYEAIFKRPATTSSSTSISDPRRHMDELSDSYVRSVAQLLLRR